MAMQHAATSSLVLHVPFAPAGPVLPTPDPHEAGPASLASGARRLGGLHDWEGSRPFVWAVVATSSASTKLDLPTAAPCVVAPCAADISRCPFASHAAFQGYDNGHWGLVSSYYVPGTMLSAL